MVAALCRALVETAAQEARQGGRPSGVRTELLRAAMWRAARSGMSDDLVDPVDARPVAAWNLIDKLLITLRSRCRPAATPASSMRRCGTFRTAGRADEQRDSYAGRGDARRRVGRDSAHRRVTMRPLPLTRNRANAAKISPRRPGFAPSRSTALTMHRTRDPKPSSANPLADGTHTVSSAWLERSSPWTAARTDRRRLIAAFR